MTTPPSRPHEHQLHRIPVRQRQAAKGVFLSLIAAKLPQGDAARAGDEALAVAIGAGKDAVRLVALGIP